MRLRNKTPKRRVKAKLRDGRKPATRSNETWAMDFVHDQLATGRKLRALTIVDILSRFCPALAPRVTFRGTDVVEILERVCTEVGFPAILSDDIDPDEHLDFHLEGDVLSQSSSSPSSPATR